MLLMDGSSLITGRKEKYENATAMRDNYYGGDLHSSLPAASICQVENESN